MSGLKNIPKLLSDDSLEKIKKSKLAPNQQNWVIGEYQKIPPPARWKFKGILKIKKKPEVEILQELINNAQKISELIEVLQSEIQSEIETIIRPDINLILRKKKEISSNLNLSKYPDYKESIISLADDYLKHNEMRAFSKLQVNLGEDIDFSVIENFDQKIEKNYQYNLSKGRLNTTSQIEENITQGNFKKTEKCQQSAIDGTLLLIRYGSVNKAIEMHKKYTKNVDFSQVEKYEDTVVSGILWIIQQKMSYAPNAEAMKDVLKFKKYFGKNINFAENEKYRKGIKSQFYEYLINGKIKIEEIINFQKKFGKSIDFTKEINNGFLNCLGGTKKGQAIQIKKYFKINIDLKNNEHENYAEKIKGIIYFCIDHPEKLMFIAVDSPKKLTSIATELIDNIPNINLEELYTPEEKKYFQENIKSSFFNLIMGKENKEGEIKIYINVALELINFAPFVDFSNEIKLALNCYKRDENKKNISEIGKAFSQHYPDIFIQEKEKEKEKEKE